MIIVYQNTNEDFFFQVDKRILFRFDVSTIPGDDVFFPEYKNDFEYVADVESNDKNVAYQLTNSIESYWGENDGVEEYGEKHRSTSVGDIMVCEDGIYAVDTCGFKKLRTFSV